MISALLALLSTAHPTPEPVMSHHLLVHLDIADADAYARYRQEMAPILERHHGHFVLDVKGGQFVHSPAPFPADRVLLLAFPDASAATAFFGDDAYVAVRSTWFEPAVAQTHAVVLP